MAAIHDPQPYKNMPKNTDRNIVKIWNFRDSKWYAWDISGRPIKKIILRIINQLKYKNYA
jgi:hypothetical protein